MAESVIQFPPYAGPVQGPAYWMDESSGVLPAAVHAYAEWRETPEQFELVRSYVQYWIDAPCWKGVEVLRDTIRRISTHEALGAWFWDALELGIDPL